MKKFIVNSVIVLALFSVLFLALDKALTFSDVYVSHSTGACVKVENFDGVIFSAGDYTCENLPSKYNHVWTK